MSVESHPNVVFIVGDNVGWGDVGWDMLDKRLDAAWVIGPVAARLGALQASMAQYPNIKSGEEFAGYK